MKLKGTLGINRAKQGKAVLGIAKDDSVLNNLNEMGDLVVDKLTFGYNKGVKTLDEVSLEVQKGQLKVLNGPNGSGKSTLLKCMVGVLEADEGDVRYFGQSILRNTIQARKQIGYVSEQDTGFKDLTP